MKRLTIISLALTLLMGWGAATACAGMYVSGNLSAVNVEDSDVSYRYGYPYDDNGRFDNDEVSFDTGIGINAALGYAWANGFRVEGEIGGRFNEMDEFDSEVGSAAIDDGYLSTFSLMANVFYDFLPGQAVSPFIGAGLGLATIGADIDYEGAYYYDGYHYYYDDDDYDDSDYDTVPAYQLAAGVSFAVTERMRIDVQYRYFATDDPEFDDLGFDDIELEYTTHSGMVGLRYNF